MRPKQCSLRAPNLRGRESERTRKEGEQNTQEKERRGGEGGVLGGAAAAGRPPPFLRAMRRRQPDITPMHPPTCTPSFPSSLPFPYYVLNPLYGKWSVPSDFQWMTGGTASPSHANWM